MCAPNLSHHKPLKVVRFWCNHWSSPILYPPSEGQNSGAVVKNGGWDDFQTCLVKLLKWLAWPPPEVTSCFVDQQRIVLSFYLHSTSVALGTQEAPLALPLTPGGRWVRKVRVVKTSVRNYDSQFGSWARKESCNDGAHTWPRSVGWFQVQNLSRVIFLSHLLVLSFFFSPPPPPHLKGSVIRGKDCAFHSQRRYFWKIGEKFGWWGHVFFTSPCEGASENSVAGWSSCWVLHNQKER